MQEETQISLNTVESVENFHADVVNGRWDAVLQSVATLSLPQSKVFDLYEQVSALEGVLHRAELFVADNNRDGGVARVGYGACLASAKSCYACDEEGRSGPLFEVGTFAGYGFGKLLAMPLSLTSV